MAAPMLYSPAPLPVALLALKVELVMSIVPPLFLMAPPVFAVLSRKVEPVMVLVDPTAPTIAPPA